MIQRVKQGEVRVDGETVSSIGTGILTFLGIQAGDNEEKKIEIKLLNKKSTTH